MSASGWYQYDEGDTKPYRRSPSPPPRKSSGTTSTSRTRRTGRRWPRRLLKTVIVLVVVLGVAFGALWVFTPSVANAPAVVQQQAVSHGISYPGVQPPTRFTQALVATEDHRFYSTPGVDPLAVARLIAGDLVGKNDQGGSTLEQQLAKNLYTSGRSGWTVKLEQVMLAIKLDTKYTKAQILQMYAEIAYYGSNYYGLQAASCGYFGVQPSQLSWPEAAFLAGVVNAPTLDNPRTNPENARNREAHVVERLVAVKVLTAAQGKAVLAQQLTVVPVGTGCTSQ
ncbi:MAG TPA: biosynthetic peptidoglycan transglycosylase [Streptosporangiaceae bacterium]|nr:biosynthetic peptidoglycan transglycosylase [Streptosporangiaceae bacterium]